jgi:hypothetical protein
MEADSPFWLDWRYHQLPDGIKNRLELNIVLFLQRGKLPGPVLHSMKAFA